MSPLEPQADKTKEFDFPLINRRNFLTRVVPACAVGCVGICAAVSCAEPVADSPPDPEKHKFDTEFPYPMTLRQYMSRQLTKVTEPLKAIASEIGEEKLVRILHDHSMQTGAAQGEYLAKQFPDRDFASYCDQFKSNRMQSIITYDIIEDTATAFEMKVTECVMVQPMLDLDAGKIGNALLCDGDYGNAHGFNPKIKLIRDKTLMLGDSYCNHRYVWTG